MPDCRFWADLQGRGTSRQQHPRFKSANPPRPSALSPSFSYEWHSPSSHRTSGATSEPWWPCAPCVAHGKSDAFAHRSSRDPTTGWTALDIHLEVAPACLFPHLTSRQCCFCKDTSTSLCYVLAFRDYVVSTRRNAFSFSGHSVALHVATSGVSMTSLTFMGNPYPPETHFCLDKSVYIRGPLFLQPP